VPFDYFEHLSARQKATYRRSDGVASVPVPDPPSLAPHVRGVAEALAADERRRLGTAVSALVAELMRRLGAGPADVEVLARRPSSAQSELHGLYTREADGSARIRVWMRTAANARPVALRTFLRTLLHECCHHLDFELLGLADTFHTQGFFRRESSLVRQLLPPQDGEPGDEADLATLAPARRRMHEDRGPRQMELFPSRPRER